MYAIWSEWSDCPRAWREGGEIGDVNRKGMGGE
jgi:hypothetical protein